VDSFQIKIAHKCRVILPASRHEGSHVVLHFFFRCEAHVPFG
jgi:hypothetical protein